MRDDRVRVAGRRPAGFLAIPALVVPVAVCGIPGHTSSGLRLAAEVAALALVVGVVGFESTASVGLVAVAASLLSLNGFAEDAYGQLGWHPAVDLRAAVVLSVALALACAARRGVDQARRTHAPGRPTTGRNPDEETAGRVPPTRGRPSPPPSPLLPEDGHR